VSWSSGLEGRVKSRRRRRRRRRRRELTLFLALLFLPAQSTGEFQDGTERWSTCRPTGLSSTSHIDLDLVRSPANKFVLLSLSRDHELTLTRPLQLRRMGFDGYAIYFVDAPDPVKEFLESLGYAHRNASRQFSNIARASLLLSLTFPFFQRPSPLESSPKETNPTRSTTTSFETLPCQPTSPETFDTPTPTRDMEPNCPPARQIRSVQP